MTPIPGRLTQSHKDFLRVLGFGVGYLPAVILPRRFDAGLVRGLTSLLLKLRPGREERLAARMADSLGTEGQGRDLTREARHRYEASLEGPWVRVRALHRGGWKGEVTLEGLEHLEAAQAAGHGTILWAFSMENHLPMMKALADAGFPVVLLSTELHGAWSEGWIAQKALAPLYRRTEKWNLAERVIIPRSRIMGGVMKTLLQRLSKENAVVLILGDISADQNIQTPFLDGQAEFARGSPSLAWKVKAALLPTFPVREETGRYRVIIDEPIDVDREFPRREYVRQAVAQFARRMETAIIHHPGSWKSWSEFWNREGIFSDAPTVRPDMAGQNHNGELA